MGREAECRVRFDGQSGAGKALLESGKILFRGDVRLRIPLKGVASVEVRDGRLRLETTKGLAVLELGPEAEIWAHKIQSPPSVLDKLGIKPDSKVSVVDLDDSVLLAELRQRASDVRAGTTARERDVVLWGLTDKRGLAQIEALRACLQPAGALWAIWPKGRKDLREDDVRAAAHAAGLVDVKVASVSDTLSGLKLVIPVKARKSTKRLR